MAIVNTCFIHFFHTFHDIFSLAMIIVANKDNFNKVRYLLMSAVNYH